MKRIFAAACALAVSCCALAVSACGETEGAPEPATEVTDAEWVQAFDLKTTNCTVSVMSYAEGETEEGLDSYDLEMTMKILGSGESYCASVSAGYANKQCAVIEGGKYYHYRYYDDAWHKSESDELFLDDTGVFQTYIFALAAQKANFTYGAEQKNYQGKIEFQDMPEYDVSVTVKFENGKLVSEHITVVGNEDGEEMTVYYEIDVTDYGTTEYELPDFE